MESALEHWRSLSATGIAVEYGRMVANGLANLFLLGLVFFAVARIRPAEPNARFFKRDFWNELCYPVFNMMVSTPLLTILTLFSTAYLLIPYVPRHIFADQITALPLALQAFIALLLIDLAVWIEHWIAHRFLWDFHALHHMTPEVSWLTHARVHPVNAITIALAGMLMNWVFGFETPVLAMASLLLVPIAAWEHANWDFAWPRPLCYLFTSPRFHRWHHAREAEAVDKNFCLIFPFIDLALGTYYCPERLPHAYGIYSAPDAADEGAAIPARFRDQLVYPFATFARRFRRARAAAQSPTSMSGGQLP